MIGPTVAAAVLGKAGAVIVFIVIFSALASSLDSLLAAISDLVTQDIYHKKLNRRRPINLMRFNRSCIFALGVITWLSS